MRKLVSREDLPKILEDLLSHDEPLVFDCETTGLSSFHNSRMFSLAVGDLKGNSWYFNFKSYPVDEAAPVLNYRDLEPLFFGRPRLWIAHNAKFDMHFLSRHGLFAKGRFADTRALARLFENHHHHLNPLGGYSLEDCAKRWLSQEKDDRVKKWMDENHAYTMLPGYQRKNYHFDLVPLKIISEYAMIDAEVTAKLYLFLKDNCYETPMWETEIDLTSALFHVEQRGVLVDRQYIEQAFGFEKYKYEEALKSLNEKIPGFTDSAKFLSPILRDEGFDLPLTDTGRDQVSDQVLIQKPSEYAEMVLKYRDANKRLNTYWTNYLYLKDLSDVIHTSFDQAGTVTGRLSARDPNLQNIPAEDVSDFPIRRAFIARPGFKIVSIDYKAVEFRLALEYAGELELIEKIKQGHDPHQATADLTGLTRKQAKTLNFAILFAAGKDKLAGMLGCTPTEAQEMKWNYFGSLPRLKSFIDRAMDRLKTRGFVENVYGRRYKFERFLYQGKWRDNSYKACNLIIQGSSADIMKRAIVKCEALLNPYESKMLLTIHDELIFSIAEDEMFLIAQLKKTMESAYDYRAMPLECSIEIGSNLHDMETYNV
jgi:DNA polymerase-1